MYNYSRSASPNIRNSPNDLRSSSPDNFQNRSVSPINVYQNQRSDLEQGCSRSSSPIQNPLHQEMGCSTLDQGYPQCTQTSLDNVGKTRWIVNPELKKYTMPSYDPEQRRYLTYDYSFPRETWMSTPVPVPDSTYFVNQSSEYYNPSSYLTRSVSPPAHLPNSRQENLTRRFLQNRDFGNRASRMQN